MRLFQMKAMLQHLLAPRVLAARDMTALLLGAWILSGCQSTLPASPSASPSKESTLPAIQRASINPAEEQAYEALEEYKAEAIALMLASTPLQEQIEPPKTFRYTSSGHPNPSAAALAALTACEEARSSRLAPTYPCELRRRNDQLIHNTWELTRGLPGDRPGFIWRVQNQDTVVYLAGSIHLLKPTLNPPPSYVEAFEQATALVLEVDQRNQSPAQMQALVQSHMLLPDGATITQLLTANEQERVQQYLVGMGADPATATVLKPAALLLTASALEYTSIGYLPEHGIESVFETKLGNRPLLALETLEQQLAAATALPLELQAELLMQTIDEADSTPEQISDLVRAWLSGDEIYLASQFKDAANSEAARQWLDDILIKRNLGMAKGIDDLLRGADQRITGTGPQTIFVLVGAGHLVGNDSVVALLEQQGYTLDRLKHSALSTAE